MGDRALLIGIVGGGITGLVLAHELVRLGARVSIWEAAGRPGGVLRSAKCGGITVELGPQRVRLTAEFRELVDGVGLSGELVTASADLPLFVYSSGKLRVAPLSLSQFVTSDLLSVASKARVLIEPLRAGPRADETAGVFLRRKFGGAAYRDLLGPLYGGLYGSDPDRMPARHGLVRTLKHMGVGRSLLWRMITSGGDLDTAPPCSFHDGLAALPLALRRALGARVRLSCAVRSLRRGRNGWETVFDAGPSARVSQVVITCPADQAAKILGATAPAAADVLARVGYNPLAVVHMRSGAELHGLGYQVAFGEAFETLGVTWNHSLFGRRGLYTAYLGGMRRPEIVGRPDEEIGHIACREFGAITGHAAETLLVSRIRMPAWDESWDGLDSLELPEGVHLCTNYTGRPGIAGRIGEARRLARRLATS